MGVSIVARHQQELLPFGAGSASSRDSVSKSAKAHRAWKPVLRSRETEHECFYPERPWPSVVREMDYTDKLMPAIGLELGYWNFLGFGAWNSEFSARE
ncbi:hypothetical protein [Desulfosarcina sp.]|uniref:hypothetical protein n=1 Tax=Desulfosarcina sp. TaxID=2027861 RepID=UPI003970FA01